MRASGLPSGGASWRAGTGLELPTTGEAAGALPVIWQAGADQLETAKQSPGAALLAERNGARSPMTTSEVNAAGRPGSIITMNTLSSSVLRASC